MGLLEWEFIKKYNYDLTKINVKIFFNNFRELYLKYIYITPKEYSSRLKEVIIDYTKTNTSYIEQYLEEKDKAKIEYLKKLDLITKILDNLSFNEQTYMKDTFINNLNETIIREKLNVSRNGLNHIKQSAIIKFALAANLIENRKGN